MSMREGSARAAGLFGGGLLFAVACAASPIHAGGDSPKLGRAAAPDVIGRMDITVSADGSGLPAGSGSVAEGRVTYEEKCAACHGTGGSGGLADRLTGGVGSLTSAKPIKTVASYWPYAPTLFDYIRRAMPLTEPQSLEDKEVYGLVAYLLSIDNIVAPDTRLDATSLSQIKMPNRDGFVSLEDRRFDGNIDHDIPSKATGE